MQRTPAETRGSAGKFRHQTMLFTLSSLLLSLPSSQRPLNSPFFGALLLTYEMWSLSASAEKTAQVAMKGFPEC